jgi:hypothetical protein
MPDDPLPYGLVEEIERVLREDTSNVGLNIYHAVFDSGLMFPLQRRHELEAMMATARSVNPRTVMEIGADKGGGVYHWIKGLLPARFIGIEIRGTPYGSLFDKAFPETKSLWISGSSYDERVVAKVGEWLGNDPIDVIFIDGDKAMFHADFLAYLPRVRHGGVIFMHDVRDDAPGSAFRQAACHERVRASLTFESTIEVLVAVAHEMAGDPPSGAHEGWLRHWRGRSCGVGVLWV